MGHQQTKAEKVEQIDKHLQASITKLRNANKNATKVLKEIK